MTKLLADYDTWIAECQLISGPDDWPMLHDWYQWTLAYDWGMTPEEAVSDALAYVARELI